MAKELLGRRAPPDWSHVERYPVLAVKTNPPRSEPVVLGINWYPAFDKPVLQNSRYYIGLPGAKLTTPREGHALVARPDRVPDLVIWWEFYDQGRDPASVGFSVSRLMSLRNRRRYDARLLWEEAKQVDGLDDTESGKKHGTTLRAGLKVARDTGVRVWRRSEHDKLRRYRWMTTVDAVREVLASPRHDRLGAVPLLSSRGRDYPHVVWLPYETLGRLLEEDGEAAVATAR